MSVLRKSELQGKLRTLLQLIRPVTVAGYRKRRLGRSFDGGYVMLDDFDSIKAAYSFGINDDVSWDKDVAELGIKVHQYDHSIDNLPENHRNFLWNKKGLASSEKVSEEMNSLEAILTANGHVNTPDLLLKMDIEDAEWEVFAEMSEDIIGMFKQIVCEFHWFNLLDDTDRYDLALAAFTNLAKNHVVIHVHANNSVPWSLLGNIPLPSVIELTFVRRDDKTFLDIGETFPGPMDEPNYPGEPDFVLGSFHF